MTAGDQGLLKQDKIDKFSTTFKKTPHKVIIKDGNTVVVKPQSGAAYSRNTTLVKEYHAEDPAPLSTNKTHGLRMRSRGTNRPQSPAQRLTLRGPEPLTSEYGRPNRPNRHQAYKMSTSVLLCMTEWFDKAGYVDIKKC